MPDPSIEEKVARSLYEYDRDERGKRRFWEGFRAHYGRMARAALAALQAQDEEPEHEGGERLRVALAEPRGGRPMKAETRRGSRDLRRAEASFDLDRALDWLDAAAEKRVREAVDARRIVLQAQARLGFTRNQASPEYLAQLRAEGASGE